MIEGSGQQNQLTPSICVIGLAQKLRAQAVQGGNHHGGRGPATERRVKNTAGGKVVVKPNTAGGSLGGLGVAIKKWSRIATLSKLTHVIMLVGCTRHRNVAQT